MPAAASIAGTKDDRERTIIRRNGLNGADAAIARGAISTNGVPFRQQHYVGPSPGRTREEFPNLRFSIRYAEYATRPRGGPAVGARANGSRPAGSSCRPLDVVRAAAPARQDPSSARSAKFRCLAALVIAAIPGVRSCQGTASVRADEAADGRRGHVPAPWRAACQEPAFTCRARKMSSNRMAILSSSIV